MKFATLFEPAPSPAIKAVGGLTQQHYRDECDLNVILRRYRPSDIPPPVDQAVYADLTSMPADLAEAYDKLAGVQDWFDSLPSDVRRSYDNDPRSALREISVDIQAAVKNGLLPPPRASQSNLSQPAAAGTPETATGASPKDEPSVAPAAQPGG